MERNKYTFYCEKCGKEYSLLLSDAELKANKYSHHCSRSCANSRTFSEESKRKTSESIKKRFEQYGPWGGMTQRRYVKHTKRYYEHNIRASNGDIVNITRYQLDQYRQEHQKCEICGLTIEEACKWDSKSAPKHLCMDHDHKTGEFRGVLCSRCNRQLGWYEKYKDDIEKYLNKDKNGRVV